MSRAQLGRQRLFFGAGSAGSSEPSFWSRDPTGVEAVEMGPVLARVGDVVGQTGQPLEHVHGLEVPAQEGIHAGAIHDGLLAVEIHELLERERPADHIAGHVLEGLLVLEGDGLTDVRGEARMSPGLLMYSARASAAHCERSSRSSRRLRKTPRRRRGMVNTTCRCGTGASTSFCGHSAHRSCFFFSHDGQKFLPRQENGQSTLVRQMPHQRRAKPCSTSPQRMNPRSTRSTTGRSGPCALANRAGPSDRAAIAIREERPDSLRAFRKTRKNSSRCCSTRRKSGDSRARRGRYTRAQISTPPQPPAGETGASQERRSVCSGDKSVGPASVNTGPPKVRPSAARCRRQRGSGGRRETRWRCSTPLAQT